jgi:hypothetical protein
MSGRLFLGSVGATTRTFKAFSSDKLTLKPQSLLEEGLRVRERREIHQERQRRGAYLGRQRLRRARKKREQRYSEDLGEETEEEREDHLGKEDQTSAANVGVGAVIIACLAFSFSFSLVEMRLRHPDWRTTYGPLNTSYASPTYFSAGYESTTYSIPTYSFPSYVIPVYTIPAYSTRTRSSRASSCKAHSRVASSDVSDARSSSPAVCRQRHSGSIARRTSSA